MSLLDDVSIVVTPNGYKAGTLYGVIPVPTEGSELVTNGTFATDSDWGYNASYWNISGGTANALGVANGGFSQTLSVTSGKLYKVKISSTITSGNGVYAVLLGTNQNNFDNNTSEITTYLVASGDNVTISIRPGSSAFSMSSLSVKEYTAADMDVTRATDATRVDEDGLIADVLSNVPRIDYTGGGCPHILAEPQRTNLLPYSSDFSQWTDTGVQVNINSTISPSGTENASTITGSTTNSRHNVVVSTISGSVSASFSVFAKAKELRYLQIASANSTNQYANFDLLSGTIGTIGGGFSNVKIESLDNDWYKISLVSNSQYNSIYLSLASSLTASWLETYSMANNSDSLYLWGGQVEVGSYATSYIPTSGSTVTRNQDIFTRDGISSLINSPEGVLFTEIAALSDDGTSRDISVSDGTSANYARISLSNAVGNIEYNVVVGSSTQASGTSAITQTNFNKIAVKWKVNDFALWVNGSEVLTDLSGTSFSASTLTTLNFDRGSGTNDFYGKVRQLQVYDTALDDTQLAALTT